MKRKKKKKIKKQSGGFIPRVGQALLAVPHGIFAAVRYS
jgi:hypothetical protein